MVSHTRAIFNNHCGSIFISNISNSAMNLAVQTMAAPIETGILPADLCMYKAALQAEFKMAVASFVNSPRSVQQKKFNVNIQCVNFISIKYFQKHIIVVCLDIC